MITQFQEHFQKRGFYHPTAIQAAIAKPLSTGRTVLGISPTGSGKTLAFTWPLLPRLTLGGGFQLLVLEPSPELAIQTAQVLREWANLLGLKVQPLTGGANFHRQLNSLKKNHPEIIVGTPGRTNHLVNIHSLKLHQLGTLVIDEADDLLREDTMIIIQKLTRAIPLGTQLVFLSATTSSVFKQLGKIFNRTLIQIDVRDQDNSRGPVEHSLIKARTMKEKAATLKKLSRTKDFRALVFFTSIKTLHYTASYLKHEGLTIATLEGQQHQTKRAAAMRKFQKQQVKFLLATDVAARGLDIPKLPVVINFELPQTANQYVHRAGRTGRQNEPGSVINLGDDHDLRDLNKLLGTKISLVSLKLKRDHQSVTKRTIKRSVIEQNQQPTSKKHKKNRKNKGIRFKHRQLAKKR